MNCDRPDESSLKFFVVTAIAFVDECICHIHTGYLLHDSDRFDERVTIVGIAFTQSHIDNPVAAICGDDRRLLTNPDCARQMARERRFADVSQLSTFSCAISERIPFWLMDHFDTDIIEVGTVEPYTNSTP